MNKNDIDINEVIIIAKKAGENVLKYYLNNDCIVHEKIDGSLVTSADMAAHGIIILELQKLTPNVPILSEEGNCVPYNERKNWKRFWLVDPLDGTKEFVKRNGEFTVNIALIENNKPKLGVIYVPVLNLVYYGETTQGSFKIDSLGNKIALKRAALSNNLKKLCIVGSRTHSHFKFDHYIQKLKKKYENIIINQIGSSLKFCIIAENEADHYPRFTPSMEWDTAAGHAIAKFSGCTILSLKSNKELSYNKKSLINDEFIVK